MHLISGAREGINGLSIRTDRKDRKLVCLRSVNCISFTQWDLDYFHGKKRIILFTHFNHTLDSDFRFLKVFFQFFYNGWFSGCFTFRLCRFAFFRCLTFSGPVTVTNFSIPFCGFKSSFSRIILCFDLRNIVGTLFSTATCTSIGNFLSQMPSQASRSLLQLQDIAYIRSDYVQKPGSNSYGYCSLWLRSWIALITVRSAQCTWFMVYRTRNITFEARLFWYMAYRKMNITCDRRPVSSVGRAPVC